VVVVVDLGTQLVVVDPEPPLELFVVVVGQAAVVVDVVEGVVVVVVEGVVVVVVEGVVVVVVAGVPEGVPTSMVWV